VTVTRVLALAAGLVALPLSLYGLTKARERITRHAAERKAQRAVWAGVVRTLNEQAARAEQERRRHDHLQRTRDAQRQACRRLGVFNQDDQLDLELRRLLGQPAPFDIDGTDWEQP
jgi:hypothetical protein